MKIYIPRYEMESTHLIDLFEAWIMDIPLDSNFFVQISFRSNHIPYVSSPELRKACMDFEICNNIQAEPFTSTQLDYAGCVSAVDSSVGRVQEILKQRRVSDWSNTIIVFTSDNGPESVAKGGAGSTGGLIGRKLSLFEGLLRVPLLMHWPAGILYNKQSDLLSSIMDITATFLELLLDPGETDTVFRDGISLLPYINQMGGTAQKRARPFTVCSMTTEVETQSRDACNQAAIIDPTGKWKLIGNRADPRLLEAQASYILPTGVYQLQQNGMGEQNGSIEKEQPQITQELLQDLNSWLVGLFDDFKTNCNGYYPVRPG